MRALPFALLLVVAGCAAVRPVPPVPDPEARAVVEATERFFDAMERRDTTALRALMHPDAQLIAIGPGGLVDRDPGGAAAWIEGVGRTEGAPWYERIRDPRVEVEGAVATLWAPYTFHVGEQFSHCGIDAFQFVREDTGWRLLVVTFTVVTEGCDAGANP